MIRPADTAHPGTAARLRVPGWAQQVFAVALALVALEAAVRVGLLPGRYFPPVSEMFTTLFELAGTSQFWSAVWNSVQGWGLGLAVATVIAIPTGMLLGSNDYAYRATRPIVEFLRPVPAVALIPFAVVVYGTGLSSKVFLAAFAAGWPLLVQSMYGVRELDSAQRDTARVFKIRRRDRFFRVVLPSAIPFIATGLRIASATALILAISAELIIGSPGIGYEIANSRLSGATDKMYAMILSAGLLGIALNWIFTKGEQIFLPWHPSQREGAGK